ncbi:hypothetical protein RRG08_051330 [Elysia crispata]|uniref:Uncharacterized protein n=1 Tax=Elysia crispata TaxID=231223 RepID=A0AAE1B5L9_9GAST|nr:hypothetical protein RRG08_051330 [Elysia crispata]
MHIERHSNIASADAENCKQLVYDRDKAVWKVGQGCPVAKCPATRYRFGRPYRLLRHWHEVHRLYVPKYKCSMCQFISKRRCDTYRHSRIKHGISVEQAIGQEEMGVNKQYVDPGSYSLKELFGQL